jgi:peroxiredoxin
MSPISFGMVLPWLLLGIGCWFGYQLVRQNGRILLRLEAMEKQLGQRGDAPTRPAGLPPGSAAPAFKLPDLAGGRKTLAQFRGRKVLLIFFNPRCGCCTKMAPDLAALAPDGVDGRPLPIVVSTGDAEANRRLFQEHDIRCPVLLQKQMEVASLYKANGTPNGYLIDEQGAIASELTVGAEALLSLAVAPRVEPEERTREGAKEPCGCGQKHEGKADKGLAASRINRNGLKAGMPAPVFCLPCVNGGELSLEEYRGRRVLLVFSDPQCGSCDLLAPRLERLHRQRDDVQVLMVSRREAEANRRKVAELGLTFPIALQKSWEISLRYGLFATPVGYLIDEQGVIAADGVAGVEPILALVSGPAAANNGQAEALHPGKEVATA